MMHESCSVESTDHLSTGMVASLRAPINKTCIGDNKKHGSCNNDR